MKYDYGYLHAVGGGAWVVYPVGADPETSYVFMSPDGGEAAQHALHLTRAGDGEKTDELQPPAQVS